MTPAPGTQVSVTPWPRAGAELTEEGVPEGRRPGGHLRLPPALGQERSRPWQMERRVCVGRAADPGG